MASPIGFTYFFILFFFRAPLSIVVRCRGVVLRVVVCDFVLVVSCVWCLVLFLLCVCVRDLFIFLF